MSEREEIYTDDDTRLIEGDVTPDYEYEEKDGEKTSEEYYDLPSDMRSRNLIWSVVAVVCSLLSVCLSMFYVAGLILSAVAVGAALVSRYRLGYFDKMSVFGLVVGIFGAVFGVAAVILDTVGILDRLFT